jgi:hypothetical protein
MRKREAEAIVDDIINEMRSIDSLAAAFEQLEENYEYFNLKQTLVKIVMDEE